MFYCSHCGIQLEDGANFCNNCGTVTEFGRTQGSAVSQSSDLKEKPVPHMSIEDSLILVEKLQKEYTELEKLNRSGTTRQSLQSLWIQATGDSQCSGSSGLILSVLQLLFSYSI